MERSRHWEGLFIFAALIALGGLYLWQNSQPAITVSVPAASPTPADAPPPEWQSAVEAQLAAAPVILPSPDPEVTAYVPPTLLPTSESAAVLLEPTEIQGTPWPTPTFPPTEERPVETGPTPFPSPTGIRVAENPTASGFEPPPEQAPLSLHANDHFWFKRPVDASANSESLFYYPFGSDGPQDEWRVHHGVDMPNPVGQEIRAGASGTVEWARNGSEALTGEDGIYPAYGNLVIIRHDEGYRGQTIWTLYAHMSAILAQEGQHVEKGDKIGLVGATGDVSGSHVHLEIRVGENTYFTVYNPLLWIVPYVGRGVVAGRVSYPDGRFIDDVVVTLTQNGRVYETTTTYIRPWTADTNTWEVMPDPAWQENFVVGDVPEGDYEISVMVGGQRIWRDITVRAGTTNFVALGVEPAATPQPVEGE